MISGMIPEAGCDMPEEETGIRRIFKGWTLKINEINEKYKNPRLKMTPLVRASLLILRLYLIFLVIVLMYKFYTVVSFR